jgi:hypothetical protein
MVSGLLHIGLGTPDGLGENGNNIRHEYSSLNRGGLNQLVQGGSGAGLDLLSLLFFTWLRRAGRTREMSGQGQTRRDRSLE